MVVRKSAVQGIPRRPGILRHEVDRQLTQSLGQHFRPNADYLGRRRPLPHIPEWNQPETLHPTSLQTP